MIISFYIVLILVVAGIAIAIGLRTLVFAEKRADDALHAPGVTTLSYVVPEGQDPAVLMAKLQNAGFASLSETHGNDRVLLIGYSDPSDRDRVREVIERVHTTTSFEGAALDVGHVTFQDET